MTDRRILKRTIRDANLLDIDKNASPEQREIQKLKRQVHILKDSNLCLIQKIESQVQRISALDQFHREAQLLKGRLGFVLSLIQFIRDGKYTPLSTSHLVPCLQSSLMRSLFEIIFHQHTEFEEVVFTFTLAPTSDTLRLFDHFCLYMSYCLNLSMKIGPQHLPSFDGFEMVNFVQISNEEVFLSFIKGIDYIPVRIYYSKIEEGHYSTSTLMLSHIGITTSRNDINMFESIRNIYMRQFRICPSLEALQQAAFPSQHSLTFEEKSVYLTRLFHLIGTNFYRQLSNEYSPYGLLPDWKIEQDQDCPITNESPPYLCYQTVCGHEISSSAYYGLITKCNQFTEAIRCPFCRADLKIRFREENVHSDAGYHCIPLGSMCSEEE